MQKGENKVKRPKERLPKLGTWLLRVSSSPEDLQLNNQKRKNGLGRDSQDA